MILCALFTLLACGGGDDESNDSPDSSALVTFVHPADDSMAADAGAAIFGQSGQPITEAGSFGSLINTQTHTPSRNGCTGGWAAPMSCLLPKAKVVHIRWDSDIPGYLFGQFLPLNGPTGTHVYLEQDIVQDAAQRMASLWSSIGTGYTVDYGACSGGGCNCVNAVHDGAIASGALGLTSLSSLCGGGSGNIPGRGPFTYFSSSSTTIDGFRTEHTSQYAAATPTNRYQLLISLISHEMGHAAGFDDYDNISNADLMFFSGLRLNSSPSAFETSELNQYRP